MKLYLENFKCFEKADIELSDEKFQLITAPSGFGKTTIFDAIKFVFWGNKNVDIITFGKKKCKVILEWKSIKFIRTKNPNNITIQNIITKEMINNPEEYINRYILRYDLNFINMKEENQRKIIDKILNQTTIEDIDITTKKLLKEGYNFIKEQQIKLETYQSFISSLSNVKSYPKPEDININENISELNKLLKNLLFNQDQKKAILAIYNNNISKIDLNVDISEKNIINQQISEIENQKNIINEQNKEKNTINNNLYSYKEKLLKISELLISQEYDIDENIVIEYKKKLDKNTEILEEIDNTWKQCTKKEKTDNILKIKKWIKEGKSSSNIQEYDCPCCKNKLIFENSKLIISNINSDFHALNKIVLLHEQLNSDINNNTYINMKNILKKKEKLSEEFKMIKFLEKDLKEKLISIPEITIDINILNDKLNNLKNIRKKIEKKISIIEETSHIDPDKISEEINEINNNILLTEEKIRNIKNYEKDMEKWINNEKIIKTKQENYEKYNYTKNIIEEKSIIIQSLESLKNTINESYMKSIKNFVENINYYLDFLMGKFFKNKEITVKVNILKILEKIKSVKYSLDIQVFHQGLLTKISTLSAGEYSRLSLAIDIALYKLSNTSAPLLLDEAIANLDTSISVKILKTINNLLHDSQIFVIAHQANEGIFDKVYDEIFFEKCVNRYLY